MVSGGLSADNVAEAVRVTPPAASMYPPAWKARQVSKDPEMIRNFIRAARATEELMVR